MHAAARGFLAGRGLTGAKPDQIDPENVFFELTKDEKVARAATTCAATSSSTTCRRSSAMRGFPHGMRKILFDPENQFADAGGRRV